MKRVIIKLCVFLILGAIVNVAVAWELAMWTPLSFDGQEVVERHAPQPLWWTDHPEWFRQNRPIPSYEIRSFGLNGIAMGADLWGCMILRSGWPFASFEHAIEFMDGAAPVPHRAISAPAFMPHQEGRAFLPIHVLPLGFAVNTIVHASLLWIVLAGLLTIRRRLRIRRGLCAKCAYPVGASDVCTECGAIVKKGMRGSRGLPSPAPPAGSRSERIP